MSDINHIRVLQVFGKLNRGGAETMLMNLYRNIDRTKVSFDFVVHTEEECDYDKEIEAFGGTIYRVPAYRGINHIQYIAWWNRFLAEHREFQIIHSHVRSTASLFFPLAQKYGLKTIIHSHSTSNGSGLASIVKKIFQYPLRYQSDYFIGCSLQSAEWLFGKDVIRGNRFAVLKNAIDTKRYKFDVAKRIEIREKLGLSDDELVFGHIGRFHEAKNHNFLFEVFADLYKNNSNARLVVIGDGDLRNSIETKIRELGIEKAVSLLGVRGDVIDLLMAMDAFLFPSKWEGLPVTVVEAQAVGLHCFVSDQVTREVELSELVHYLSIDQGTESWVEAVNRTELTRKDVNSKIVDAGFDIYETAEWLEAFYLRIVNE